MVSNTPWFLYLGKGPVPSVQENGGPQEWYWTFMENLAPIGIRSLDCSTHASNYTKYALMATKQNETKLKFQCAQNQNVHVNKRYFSSNQTVQ